MTLEESLGVDPGQLVAAPGGRWVCPGCGWAVARLYRGESARTARCIRCLAGMPPKAPPVVDAQPRLVL